MFLWLPIREQNVCSRTGIKCLGVSEARCLLLDFVKFHAVAGRLKKTSATAERVYKTASESLKKSLIWLLIIKQFQTLLAVPLALVQGLILA